MNIATYCTEVVLSLSGTPGFFILPSMSNTIATLQGFTKNKDPT